MHHLSENEVTDEPKNEFQEKGKGRRRETNKFVYTLGSVAYVRQGY